MVAGAVKKYHWSNKTKSEQGFKDLLLLKIKQKNTFTIGLLETALGYNRKKSYKENHLTEKEAERITKQAYYYLSKFIKEKRIKKTGKYEYQKNTKALMIYKLNR